MNGLDWGELAWAAFSLFAGGAVKGTVGLGLPLIAMPLLTLVFPLKEGVAMLVVPMVATNLVQAFQGGLFPITVRRFWSLLLLLLVSVAAAVKLLQILPQEVLYVIIGTALIVLPLIAHLKPTLQIPPARERWLNPALGLFSGVMGGISSFYGPPLMIYLVWLRLPKDLFVAAVSLMYFIGAVGLTLGLVVFGVAQLTNLAASTAGLVPCFLGLWIGQRLRVRLDEKLFARILLVVYLVTGVTFLAKAV